MLCFDKITTENFSRSNYILYSEGFYCFDAKNGQRVGAFASKIKPPFYSVEIVDGIFYCIGSFGQKKIVAVDRPNKLLINKILWSKEGLNQFGTPLFAGNLIYYADTSLDLHAVDRKTGQENWVFKMEDVKWTEDDKRWASHVYENGMICFSKAGIIYGIDAETGVERWKYQTKGVENTVLTLNEGILTFLSKKNVIHVLNVKVY